LQERIRKLQSLLELGQIIGLDLHIGAILVQIARKAAEVMAADRCTLFLHDGATDELWSTVAMGLDGGQIRMPARVGLAGHCFQSGETINLEDAYEDPRFNREVDARTGYRTRTVLCMPIFGRAGERMGAIQLINKKDGLFTDEDERFLRTFRNHASMFIEMAQLQKARFDALQQSREEFKRLNRVKDKALHHLSHELKTPLSVIRGTLGTLKKKIGPGAEKEEGKRLFLRLEKQVERLTEIQRETDEIMRAAHPAQKGWLVRELDQLLGRVEQETPLPEDLKEQWMAIRRWMKGSFTEKPLSLPSVALPPAVRKALGRVRERARHRRVRLVAEGAPRARISASPSILDEVLDGLLKNAVENTPDGSMVRVSWEVRDHDVLLKVQDFGTGIAPEHQPHIFEGFFHTQDTDLYSSKRPYDFNAGGKGLDLMRITAYSHRFGFQLAVESSRCTHLPTNRDLCPGAVAACPPCRQPEDCLSAGGSEFRVAFPVPEGGARGRAHTQGKEDSGRRR
jgi:signal transduction histidine kinase